MWQRLITGKMGTKTLTAAVILIGLVAADQWHWLNPEQIDKLFVLANALGFVGLRDAMSKLKG